MVSAVVVSNKSLISWALSTQHKGVSQKCAKCSTEKNNCKYMDACYSNDSENMFLHQSNHSNFN